MIGLIKRAFFTEGHEALPLTASLFARTDMGIEGFDFDLFIDESHGLDFQMSEHPVQDGAEITDHVTQKLRQCKITGMFTNHPSRRRAGNTETIKIEGYESSEITENVARDRYNDLEKLAMKREPVRLVTSLVVYPKMIITQIKAERGPKDGECVKFKMTLKEFRKVDLYEVSADFIYNPESMELDIDKLVASVAKNGLVSAKDYSVNDMKKMWGAQ